MNSTFRWLCGDNHGITVWHNGDFGQCFEQLTFSCSTHLMVAVVSSYHLARHQYRRLHGVAPYSPTVHVRFATAVILVILSVVGSAMNMHMKPVDVITWCISAVAWLLHAGFVWRLHHLHHIHIRGPTPVVCVMLLRCAAVVVQVRSSILRVKSGDYSATDIATIIYGVLHVVYLLSLVPSKRSQRLDVDLSNVNYDESESLLAGSGVSSYGTTQLSPDDLGAGDDNAGCLSWLSFWWVHPLLYRGAAGRLQTSADLFSMPRRLNTVMIEKKFEKDLEGSPGGDRTMLSSLHRVFGCQYYMIGILKLLSAGLGFMNPILLNRIVTYMSTDPSPPAWHGYVYAALLSLCTFLVALLNVHFNYALWVVSLKIRAAVRTTVYRRVLGASSASLSRFSTGEVLNLMSTDAERVVRACFAIHQFWSLPFEIAVSLFLLHQLLGLAFLAGMVFVLLLIPVNKWLAKVITRLNKALMARKDARVKMMSEILNGIRVIKLYAWEKHFIHRVNGLRQLELRSLKGMKYLDALCVYFWATTPALMSILTFTTYALLGNTLTAAKVFTSITLFNMLITPLNALPFVINSLIEAWTSLCRVQGFIELPRIDKDTYYAKASDLPPDDAIKITDGNFSWSDIKKVDNSETGMPTDAETNVETAPLISVQDNGHVPFCANQSEAAKEEEDAPTPPSKTLQLLGLNITIKKHSLVGVVGSVGAGKSSLLNVILGEMLHDSGAISISRLDEGFGLVAQEAWVQHATFRDNILFGTRYDERRYDAVMAACALYEDIEILPAGDKTEVGENGVTLSGGQKTRVTLARSIYQDKNTYLLDDPLAAVDAHIAQHLFDNCIMGMLKDKTRILCTHHTRFLTVADMVIRMEDGRIVQAGPPNEVLSAEDYQEKVSDTSNPSSNDDGDNTIDGDALASAKGLTEGGDGILMEEEEKEEGVVKMHVYRLYWRALGSCMSVMVLLSLLLMQASRNINDWWLMYWINHSHQPTSYSNMTTGDFMFLSTEPAYQYQYSVTDRVPWSNVTSAEDNVTFYLMIYGGIAILNSFFTLVRAFLFAYACICAAIVVHRKMLDSIMKTPIVFFDTTPIGRIINRFSADVYAVDDALPFMLNIVLANVYGLMGSIVVTCYGLPWFMLLLFPIGCVYYFVQRFFRKTSRELKRIGTITLSPILAHFSESLIGLITIRAFRQVEKFKEESRSRIDSNQRASFSNIVATRWLGLRLQMIGVTMVTAVAFLAVIEHRFRAVNPGLVGLALSYILPITGLLNGVIMSFTETEKHMVSVERANQYIEEIAHEKQHAILSAPAFWPIQGHVAFRQVQLRYRPGLPYALNGVSFETQPIEKIGIVGRTGSGKSSLFRTLFRIVEIQSGQILIDGINISHLPLDELRSRLAIIPQDPFLFSGSVRENLDPTGVHTDATLWQLLERCHLTGVVRRLGGLDAEVGERGCHFSVGQRQLVCLTRALLTHAKVLCIDEATASVDRRTDALIQATIREQFADNTVLTIAHRIDTVLDNDRVLVMGGGRVIEFDPPGVLLANKQSVFYGLVHGVT